MGNISVYGMELDSGDVVMETIEFRGRDLTGEWHYGNAVQTIDNHAYLITGACGLTCYSCKQVCINAVAVEVEPKSISQFTGLLDKYGTRIYENDILYDDYDDELYYVAFDEGQFKGISSGFMIELSETNQTSWVRGSVIDDAVEEGDLDGN